jgi:hypothetical protein
VVLASAGGARGGSPPRYCSEYLTCPSSRQGSLGCSLCSVHEASDFPHFPTSFAQKGRTRLLARIDGLRDQGDWKANGTGLSSDFRRGAAN